MNKRMIARTLGFILLAEAALLLLPVFTALYYQARFPSEDNVLFEYLATAGIAAAFGLILISVRPKDKTIYARDGFAIVSLGWIVMSLVGAIPFTITGEIPNYLDALFEIVSGFTTTGASILSTNGGGAPGDLSALSHASLLWRSFSHWLGGMGVLVFLMAVLPLAGGGGDIHLMRAESPGPDVGKLVPKSNQSARILYLIYTGLTLTEILLLYIGHHCGTDPNMDFFTSVCLSFGTAGTGGFATRVSGFADYSHYSQTVIAVFMMLFGINFSIYYLLLCKRFKDAFRDEELRIYLGVLGIAVALVTINTFKTAFTSFGDALHHAFFQVTSVITTTGFSTVDFNQWPNFSRVILFLLMFLGASAGSTGGGVKVVRCILMLKAAKVGARRLSHPRNVTSVTFNGKPVSRDTLNNTTTYFIVYSAIYVTSVILVALDPNLTSITSVVTGVAATLNNIGPALEELSPTANYGFLWPLSKIVFIFDMLLGRLEIFPLLFLVMPSAYKRHFRLHKPY